MHNDLSHRKILRQSDKSFIQFCIHKLEVKRSKLASGTTLSASTRSLSTRVPDDQVHKHLTVHIITFILDTAKMGKSPI